ncbi:MAG: hypothetical protein IKZ59_00980 [Clostridia bacterium]|nr:hypothetical protein [Clostridia bacterium]
MKRYISIFVTVLVLLFCLSGCEKDNVQSVDTDTVSTKNTVDERDLVESLTEKLIREFDDTYLEESELPEYGTTVGMVELADRYTEKWKLVADEYYNKIMKYDGIIQPSENYYSSDDLHTFVSNMNANWEEYNKKQCENYLKTLQSIYGDGTIARPIYASYKYERQKEWALQVVGIYEQLNIE